MSASATNDVRQLERYKARLNNMWRMATGKLKSPDVACTPHEVVMRLGPTELLHYRARVSNPMATPIVMVPSLVNRHFILDLTIDRSVAGLLLDQGFDVYMVNWGVPDAGDEHTTLDEYILGRLHRLVRHVAGPERRPVTLLGYCMGGTLTLMYAALRPHLVQNIVLMATPVDISDDGLLALWSQGDHFDFDALAEAWGLVDGDFLQSGFTLMKPTWPVRQMITLWKFAWSEEFIRRHLAMSKWVNSPIPVAGPAYAKWCKDIYRDNLLVNGGMLLGGEDVHLGAITASVFNAVAKADHIIPPAVSTALDAHLTGTADFKTVVFPCGHAGLSVGAEASEMIWPQIGEWLAERSVTH